MNVPPTPSEPLDPTNDREHIAGLAHDLRNMLAPAVVSLQDLQNHVDPAVRGSTATAMLAISSCCDILSDHLHKREHLPRARRKISELVDLAFETATTNGTATLQTDFGDADVAPLYEQAVFRCIFNLFVNAVREIGDDLVLIVRAGREEDIITIDISDNGPGLPSDVLGWLERTGDRPTARPGRTGLGLATVAALLSRMGGELRALDVERGAAFSLRLPLDSFASRG